MNKHEKLITKLKQLLHYWPVWDDLQSIEISDYKELVENSEYPVRFKMICKTFETDRKTSFSGVIYKCSFGELFEFNKSLYADISTGCLIFENYANDN